MTRKSTGRGDTGGGPDGNGKRARSGRQNRERGPRMDGLADLTPENVRGARRKGPAPAANVDPEVQRRWEEKTAAAEARAGQRTKAPLYVLGLGAVGVLGVVAWTVLGPGQSPTLDSLQQPVVGALDGGSAVYPANSAEAVGENVRFGQLPAVELAELADGTVVLGAEESSPFEEPYGELSPEEFADGSVPAPRDDTGGGTPVTWEQIYADYGSDTVLMPAVDTAGELRAVLDAAVQAERTDALIVRTEDADMARAVADAGARALYTVPAAEADADGEEAAAEEGSAAEQGDAAAADEGAAAGDGAQEASAEPGPADLADSPFTMVAVPQDSEDLEEWLDTELGVWVTGVDSPERFTELGETGVFGALTANPYEVRAPE